MTNEIKKWQQRAEEDGAWPVFDGATASRYMGAEIAELRAKVESLAADAERYRWLRDHACIAAPVKPAALSYDPPEWTDSAVDACMAKEKA